jgi:hypothetical protein
MAGRRRKSATFFMRFPFGEWNDSHCLQAAAERFYETQTPQAAAE